MATVYELRRLKNSQDRNLAKALDIYTKNIEPVLRTNTNEIVYWLDHYNSKFKDRFFLLGFFLNNQLVGYAQLAYFVEERIVFVDYIVIDKDYRRNNTFYELVESIRSFTDEEHLVYDFIVGEVGYLLDNKEPSETTRNLIRLLKMSGFGVVKTAYYQPMLGTNNYESELQSILMIHTDNEVKKIKRETFLNIVETIYFNHYKRWYDRFLSEKDQSKYNDSLVKLFNKIEVETKKREFIEINGYSHLFSTTAIVAPQRQYIRLAKLITLSVTFLLIAVVIGSAVIFLKNKYALDEKQLTFISIGSFVILFVFIRVFFVNKTESLTEIIEKVLRVNQ